MRFDCLVSKDGGLFWRRHAAIEAMSPSAAIRRLVAGYPAYAEDDVRFHITEAEKFLTYDAEGKRIPIEEKS